MLSDASEKLQINFSRFLWSSMLANVTMPLIVAAAAEPISDISIQEGETSMTSRNLKRFAASGGTALVLAGMLTLSGLTVRAQSEANESHSLEGTWRLQITVRDCQTGQALRTFPALFAFAKGGTLTATTAGQLPSLSTTNLGVWRHTEGHTYRAVSETFIFSPAGAWIQTHRLTRTIEIGNDGDEFTETVGLQIFGTTGNLIATGCATSVASRLELSGE
jgi:hypothetical protein